MAGRDVLRVLWSEGVRVTKRSDGSLGLAPPELVTADIRHLARDARSEIEAVVQFLPSPNCCQICGTPVYADGLSLTNCTDCALIAAERMGLTQALHGYDIPQEQIA